MQLLKKGAQLFDALNAYWESPLLYKRITLSLVFLFFFSVIVALLKAFQLLPPFLDEVTPDTIFFPIYLAFALILGLELIALIFSLAESSSKAIAIQIEIMALILMRNIFKEISVLNNPNDVVFNHHLLLELIILATGALVLFFCLGIYLHLAKKNSYTLMTKSVRLYFKQKKCICLLLFIAYILLAIYDIYIIFVKNYPSEFFLHFYNLLIFADILLLLLNHYVTPSFHATFKNSGYAVGTLFMRISLTAEPLWGVSLSLFATLYVIGVAWLTNKFKPASIELHEKH